MLLKKGLIPALILILILLNACAKGKGNETISSAQVYTQAAETVQAQLTLRADGKTTPTMALTNTLASTATKTPQKTETPIKATATTPVAAPTQSSCTYRATFVDDVNYPDDSEVAPGTEFIKSWKMMNSGTCTWTSNYLVVLMSTDGMTAPDETPLTSAIEVPAGAQININVPVKAPENPGVTTAYFKFKAPDGTIFGINADGAASFYVRIKVISGAVSTPTQTPVPTLEPTESS